MLGIIHQLMSREVHILQTFKQTAINNVCLDDILNILGMHLDVCGVVGHNPDNGSLGAKAETSCSYDIDTTAQAILGNDTNKTINDFKAVRAIASRPAATQDLKMRVANQTVCLYISMTAILIGTHLFLLRFIHRCLVMLYIH